MKYSKTIHSINLKRYSLDCLLLGPVGEFTRFPYLGLCYLAGSLRDHGIGVEIYDHAAIGVNKLNTVINTIKEKRPRIIGITINSRALREGYEMIQALQQEYPAGDIIVGGPHINSDLDIIIPLCIKYAMRGDCEESMATFCEQILGGGKPKNIPGLITNNNGHLAIEEPALITDLDTLPKPAYDLLPIEKYYSPHYRGRTISMINSRGCLFRCVYCSKLNQKHYRYQSNRIVVEQLEYLLFNQKVKYIEFVDELFTAKQKRVKKICEEIIDRGFDFKWGVQTRANMIDEDLIMIMKEAGCHKITFGVETGSERIRFLGGKKVLDEDYFYAIKLCRKYKIRTMANYIFGHPTETKEDMIQTLRFAKKLPSHIALFNFMMPLPGSKLFKQAVHRIELPV